MVKRYLTLLFFLVCDFISVAASLAISLLIAGRPVFNTESGIVELSYLILPIVVIIIFYIFKIYNILWRYSNIAEFVRIAAATFISMGILFIAQMAIFNRHFELSVYFVTLLLMNCFAHRTARWMRIFLMR